MADTGKSTGRDTRDRHETREQRETRDRAAARQTEDVRDDAASRSPLASAAQSGDDTATVEVLAQHGVTISWALTPNGWKHVVWDGDRQVFSAEFYDEAFQHAKTYASGKLGMARQAIAVPASEGSASSGDRVSLSGDTALASEYGSQGQAGALGEPALLRENLVDGVPIHSRDAANEGMVRTTAFARNDSAIEANPNLETPVALSKGAPPADSGADTLGREVGPEAGATRPTDPFAPIDRTSPQSVWTGQTARANDPDPQASTGLVNPQAAESPVRGDHLDPRPASGQDNTDATKQPVATKRPEDDKGDDDKQAAAERAAVEKSAATQSAATRSATGQTAAEKKADEKSAAEKAKK